MGRRRLTNQHLPQRVYERRGRFYYYRPNGEWVPLGTDWAATWKQVAILMPAICGPEVQRHLARTLSRARERAKRRAKPFTLSWSELLMIWNRSQGRCEVTGIPFRFERVKGFSRRPYAPSLDRIDSSKPYELANCRLVCTAVNIAINEWGLETFSEFARALRMKERTNIRLVPSIIGNRSSPKVASV